MTTHERRTLTTDCLRHQATDIVPCWCGATEAPARGLNVLSSAPWTAGGIGGLIQWFGTADRSRLPRYARNLSGLLKPLPPEIVAPEDMLDADLMAALMTAYKAGDEATRAALDAELSRRDAVDAFAAAGTYQSMRSDRTDTDIDADYAAYLHSQYLAACNATHSYLVSDAGKRKGYQGADFFRVGRRPSVERWGTDELRAWFGSESAMQSDTAGSGRVMSKTEYARLSTQRRPEMAAA